MAILRFHNPKKGGDSAAVDKDGELKSQLALPPPVDFEAPPFEAPRAPHKNNFTETLRIAKITARASMYALWIPLRTTARYLRRHPLHAIVMIALVGIITLLVFTGSEIHNQMILSKISDQTTDRIIHGSRFTRSYNADEITANGERDFARVGAPEWMQRESVRAILFYARKAELPIEDQAALLAIADIESGFNPMARALTTTACGLFQFVKRTGERFNLTRADCMDPWLNAKAGVDHYVTNYNQRVAPYTVGIAGAERAFRAFELSYYLHHDGPESTNPGNEVKATILSGSQVLFKSYHALLDEQESQKHAPTFAETFSSNLWKIVGTITQFFGYGDGPFTAKLGALRDDAGEDSKKG